MARRPTKNLLTFFLKQQDSSRVFPRLRAKIGSENRKDDAQNDPRECVRKGVCGEIRLKMDR